jgi:hypothetical protein
VNRNPSPSAPLVPPPSTPERPELTIASPLSASAINARFPLLLGRAPSAQDPAPPRPSPSAPPARPIFIPEKLDPITSSPASPSLVRPLLLLFRLQKRRWELPVLCLL